MKGWLIMNGKGIVLHILWVCAKTFMWKGNTRKTAAFNTTVCPLSSDNVLQWPLVSVFNLRHYKVYGHHFHTGKCVNRPLLAYCTSCFSESLFLSCLTSILENTWLAQIDFRVTPAKGIESVWYMKPRIKFLCNIIQLLWNCLDIRTVIVWRRRTAGWYYR